MSIRVLLFYMTHITSDAIRYTGWLCRSMVSATSFTLVGVVNKFLTVLLNVVIWDKHSTPLGLVAVCICLASGSLYQQAPRRNDEHKQEVGTTVDDSVVQNADAAVTAGSDAEGDLGAAVDDSSVPLLHTANRGSKNGIDK